MGRYYRGNGIWGIRPSSYKFGCQDKEKNHEKAKFKHVSTLWIPLYLQHLHIDLSLLLDFRKDLST